MEKTARHVIKSNDVKLEGQIRLDVCQGDTGSANERSVISTPAQASVVEHHPEFAVIEVTCSCGTKMHIRCEYTDAQSTEKGPGQKINGENKNEN